MDGKILSGTKTAHAKVKAKWEGDKNALLYCYLIDFDYKASRRQDLVPCFDSYSINLTKRLMLRCGFLKQYFAYLICASSLPKD